MATTAVPILLILFYLADIFHAQSKVLTIQDILPEDPTTYDKTKPPKIEDEPAIVNFHVTVMGLDSINENSMTYSLDIFFAQTWNDFRLRLPENMTQDYRLLEADWLKHLWQPDSYFKNAKSVSFQTMTVPNHYLRLYNDKTILYMMKISLVLSCAMDFTEYPHDTQECKFQIESLSHTIDDLVFEWDYDVPVTVVKENIELPQLQLVENGINDCTQLLLTDIPCLEVVFILKRRLGYHLLNTYIPTCLIVIVSWISFWIKPMLAPARITLGTTSLLTLYTQHAKSQAYLPPISYLKAVDVFLSVSTIFVFMVLLEFCLVNVVLGDDKDVPNAPKPSPRIIEDTDPNKKVLTQQERELRALSVDRFSRVFFPFLFAILNATYWIVFSRYF